ncbi:MAG: redox-sensitive bicupin YhaK (pirin superfamily) [Bacteriovoracaceae bacterium]|jgi:redox-sensitive bicupin YhaK (pirin superfamily)
MKDKKLRYSFKVADRHWVGNGFYVHGLLRPTAELNDFISPFILMDYASPKEFSSTSERRGVGEHPHRGFETVTLSYQGEIEHRDSSGGGGIIKEGGVQWMTAGAGIVHDEFHSTDFSKRGGVFEMVQLWVNLPSKDKMTKPKYQGLDSEEIPKTKIGQRSYLRIIAGEYANQKGAVSTFSEINMFDLVSEEEELNFLLKEDSNTILLVMKGEALVDDQFFDDQSILIFDRGGDNLKIKTSKGFKALLLNGAPLNEPVVARGPFVMNTEEEIAEAMRDYQNGKMGSLN